MTPEDLMSLLEEFRRIAVEQVGDMLPGWGSTGSSAQATLPTVLKLGLVRRLGGLASPG
jgi:hypothetical protein